MAARATPVKVAVAAPRQTDIQLTPLHCLRRVLEVMLNEGWWVCATAKFELDKLPNYSACSGIRQCGVSGVKSNEDVQIAKAGIAALGMA
ncbi:MAG: hypothetical protein EOO79_05390, partial [Oxalobacteraceae bacterium]